MNLTTTGESYTVTVGSRHNDVLHYSGKTVSGTVIKAYQRSSTGFAILRLDDGSETVVPAERVKAPRSSMLRRSMDQGYLHY